MPQVDSSPYASTRPQLEKYSACETCVFWILGIGCCRSNSPFYRSNMPVPVCSQHRALPGTNSASPFLGLALN